MKWQIIPVDESPDCRRNVLVEIGGERRTLAMRLRFNPIGGYWTMDIADADTGAALLCGVPLVGGAYPAANLLRQYEHLGLGAATLAPLSKTHADRPGPDDLATAFALCWGG